MELNTYPTDGANWTITGSVEPPRASTLHPFIAYIKNGVLVVSDIGDSGMVHEARWKLEQWIAKVSGEMGYKILIAALVDPDLKGPLNNILLETALKLKIGIIWDAEWRG